MAISFSRRILTGAAVTLIGAGIVGGTTVTSLTATPTAAKSAPATGTAAGPTAPKDHRDRHALAAELVQLTAKQTGTTPEAVRAALRTGKSLNEIAGDKAPAVEAAALQDIKTRLDKAVAAGKITAAKEQDLLAKAKTRIEKLMARHGHDRTATAGGSTAAGTTTH